MSETQEELSFLEKWAIRKLQYFSKIEGVPKDWDGIHILTQRELTVLKGIENKTVIHSAIIGAVSAFMCVLSSFLPPLLFTVNDSWTYQIQYWLVVGLVTLLCTIGEFYLLFIDGLKSTNKLAHTAGFDIPENKHDEFVLSLARAALEIPNSNKPVLGVDPFKYANKTNVYVLTILYKIKIIASNAILKFVLVRLLGNVIAKSYFEFISVLVTAFWDGYITRKIMREARIRTIGPSAVTERVQNYLENADKYSVEFKKECLRAVAAAITQTEEMHPNLQFLLLSAYKKLQLENIEFDVDDMDSFLVNLNNLKEEEQLLLVKMLTFAIVIDGKISADENLVLIKACKISNLKLKEGSIQNLLKMIYNGKPFSVTDLYKAS